jgi:hypothetical protein
VLAAMIGLVALPLLTLALVIKLDTPGEDAAPPVADGPTGWHWLDEMLVRIRIWHAVVSVALTGLILMGVTSHFGEPFLFLAVVLVALLFLRAWRHTFVALMACRDDAFPGRSDKLVWALLLVLAPPVGFICFRAYRHATRRAQDRVGARDAGTAVWAKPEPFHDLA